ncbi:hypothetical protein BD779DRAFT_1482455, partial [Infundibulicybe gibba]
MPNTSPQQSPTLSFIEDEQMQELEELAATAVEDPNNTALPSVPKKGQKCGRDETDINPEPNNNPNNPLNPHKRPVAPTKLITPTTPHTAPTPSKKMTTTAATPQHPTTLYPEETHTNTPSQNPTLSQPAGPHTTTITAPKTEDYPSNLL